MSNWQAPPNYIAVPSAVEGITVFAPRPTISEVVDAPKTFNCPQCGATTKFDVAAGSIACEHCGYVAPQKTAIIGQRAAEFEFTLETLAQAAQGWGMARKELHCENCGADLALDAHAIATTCPFCASSKVNLRQAASAHLRPRFLVPFKLTPETMQTQIRHWLGQGWFHPDALARQTALNRFTGIYLSFWTFDAQLTADWKAEVGYEEKEGYFDTSDFKRKERTVIKWYWRAGRVPLPVDDLLVAGSSRVSQSLLARIQPFALNGMVAYAPDYLAGWQAQAYDVPLMKAWEQGKTQMREAALAACQRRIDSPHVRNFGMSVDYAGEEWRYILLPVYLMAYRFGDKSYQVMVNGQTGQVAGQKPVAWWKVWLAIGAMLSPAAVVGLCGLMWLQFNDNGIALVLVAAALFLSGLGGAISVYHKAALAEAL